MVNRLLKQGFRYLKRTHVGAFDRWPIAPSVACSAEYRTLSARMTGSRDMRLSAGRTKWQPFCTRRVAAAPEQRGMTDAMILELGLQAMTIAAKMAAPILLTALAVGFVVSLFQSVTQIQESTLAFVPKAAACGAALLFSGNWMLHEMITYTTQLFEKIPQLLG
jgi:flagellar biosynthetic protein FliQ